MRELKNGNQNAGTKKRDRKTGAKKAGSKKGNQNKREREKLRALEERERI